MKNLCSTLLQASDGTDQTSTYIDTNQLVAISFQAYFGDTDAAGTLKVQASNDPTKNAFMATQDGFTPTNWTDITDASATVTAGASVLIPLPQICYRWLRVVYTSSAAGSSTITVNMNALSI